MGHIIFLGPYVLQNQCHSGIFTEEFKEVMMVLALDEQNTNEVGFMIMPNAVMPWRQQILLYSIIAAFSLGVGVGFFFQGLTLILPFAGLEVSALGIALYFTARQGTQKEVIRIRENKVIVETGMSQPDKTYFFERTWLQVVHKHSSHSWYPSSLLLRSHGKQLEIGQFLNEEERKGLAIDLRNAIKAPEIL